MGDLPVPHQGEYPDPLEAKDPNEAVGIYCANRVTIAMGNEAMEEWIKIEGEGVPVER